MTTVRRSETLYQFFGGYFHQDWNLHGSDWLSVVQFFRAESDPSDVAQTAMDLRTFLALGAPEDELERQLFDQLGCYFTPRPDLGGPSFRV